MTRSPFPSLAAAALVACATGSGAQALTVAPGTDMTGIAGNYPLLGEFVEGPTSPGKWGDPTFGTGAEITYSFMGSGLEVDSGATSVALSTFMPAGYKDQFVAAFDAWAAVADLTFTEVTDPGVDWRVPGAGAADIRISGHAFDGPNGVLAHGFFPPENGGAAAGDIHFNSADNWVIGFAGPGFDIFQVAAHEIGHAIGLAHECGDDGTDTPCEIALMNPFYTEAFRGLRADDIAGAQTIYGAATAAPIPLPASLPLLGSMLALLGWLGLRRRAAA